MDRIKSFFSLNRQERGVVARSILLLPISRLMTRLLGYKAWHKALLNRRGPQKIDFAAKDGRAYGSLVNDTSYSLPGSYNCLQRSLVLQYLLQKKYGVGELRIGVASDSVGIRAHAWVEMNGEVVNDSPAITEQFAPFDSEILPPDFRFRN